MQATDKKQKDKADYYGQKIYYVNRTFIAQRVMVKNMPVPFYEDIEEDSDK